MIKLVVATGFLAVFGLVGYAIILFLKRAFDKQEQNQKENNNSINQKPKTEENGTK